MLVPICLSLFWAICSTVLIQPWFWKGVVKRKTLVGDKKYRGFSNSEKNELRNSMILQIVFACVTFFISLMIYLGLYTRYNFYGSIVSILLVLLFQWITLNLGWNSNTKIKSFIILIIAVICLFFSVTELITSHFKAIDFMNFTDEVPIIVSTVEQNETQKQIILPNSQIASLFNATNVYGPVYSNGKFVYTVSDSPHGYGVVIVEQNSGETAKFVACNFKFETSLKLRQKYPFSQIREIDKVVSNDNTPFGMYAILNKPNIFGAPVVEKYVLQNMLTGEFLEYTPDELPEFARN